ncbi:MAG: hypothetical protein ABIK83_08085 [Candidatus Zixiibacteriota bacterium]
MTTKPIRSRREKSERTYERSADEDNSTKKDDKSTWAIGGVLMGAGAGFFFLRESLLGFVVCILPGIGLVLMVTSIVSSKKG